MSLNKRFIIAHRGESYDAPENTLVSINLAWERNADAIEIDIQLCKDNKIVVIHDSNTKRTGKKNKNVSKQTLNELKELDIGSFKGTKWKNVKIPTLEEVLKTIPDNKKIIIEIKSNKRIVEYLKKTISYSGLKNEQIELIAFDFNTIVLAKKEIPNHKALWLIEYSNNKFLNIFKPSINKIVKRIKSNNLDGIDISFNKAMDENFVKKIKSKGITIYSWTINDPIIAKKMIDIGIDGITTDKAQWLKEKISNI